MIAKYFATSFAMLKRRQRAARHQQLFPDLHDLDELRRVAVEIDHVAGFARGLRAGVHRHADIGLRESGRVVRAVAGHGDEPALRLLVADAPQFVLGRGLRHEIIHAGFRGDRAGGERVVAGDHDGADAHFAKLREAFLDAAFDDVFQLDHAERFASFARRRAALPPRLEISSTDFATTVG